MSNLATNKPTVHQTLRHFQPQTTFVVIFKVKHTHKHRQYLLPMPPTCTLVVYVIFHLFKQLHADLHFLFSQHLNLILNDRQSGKYLTLLTLS